MKSGFTSTIAVLARIYYRTSVTSDGSVMSRHLLSLQLLRIDRSEKFSRQCVCLGGGIVGSGEAFAEPTPLCL
jgi:hypothetical protein